MHESERHKCVIIRKALTRDYNNLKAVKLSKLLKLRPVILRFISSSNLKTYACSATIIKNKKAAFIELKYYFNFESWEVALFYSLHQLCPAALGILKITFERHSDLLHNA